MKQLEFSDGGIQFKVEAADTGGDPFVAELTVADIDDHVTDPEIAKYAGQLTYALTQLPPTEELDEIGAPFGAVSAPNLPRFNTPDLVRYATGDGQEIPDNKLDDYGLPWYAVPKEDPDGHIINLRSWLAEQGVPVGINSGGNWHADLRYMRNRPDRTTLQAEELGDEVRPGANPEEKRSTEIANGRVLYELLLQEVDKRSLDVDLSKLEETNSFAKTFAPADRFHILGAPITRETTHPFIDTDVAGNSAFMVGSLAAGHAIDGSSFDEDVGKTLDKIVRDELLGSGRVPTFEHQYLRPGSKITLTNQTPHRTGNTPLRVAELRRVTTLHRDKYDHDGLRSPHQERPEGFVRADTYYDSTPESYQDFIDWAAQGAVDLTVDEVDTYFVNRCIETYNGLISMSGSVPDLDIEGLCVYYATHKMDIPGINTLADFKRFAGIAG